MKICFATHNVNKLREIQQLVPEGVQLVSLTDLGQTEEIPETGTTLEENSAIKARFVFQNYQIPVFADDTGLEVDALNGAPGVYSARYAGEQKNNNANIQLLLQNLRNERNREAAFKTVITYIDQEGTEKQFVGRAEGAIIDELRGAGGFGYDPIFLPTGESVTFAEMSAEEKNAISHRGKAIRLFVEFLNKR